jgi:hypothetical protein
MMRAAGEAGRLGTPRFCTRLLMMARNRANPLPATTAQTDSLCGAAAMATAAPIGNHITPSALCHPVAHRRWRQANPGARSRPGNCGPRRFRRVRGNRRAQNCIRDCRIAARMVDRRSCSRRSGGGRRWLGRALANLDSKPGRTILRGWFRPCCERRRSHRVARSRTVGPR